ncbi:hypothetical protein MIC448_860014 [Microbacterium sp. C448]|uniref:hypothetical protein n=1 Tax=Microbacterium sp. C448 TaxID=1177594 RepID=UPI0003DE2B82|nr:hypothetical protein [Microbacterium sp. C448]CDK01775.1 hypothetical protein MIC448_860014 [Microbacterium sp. C448]
MTVVLVRHDINIVRHDIDTAAQLGRFGSLRFSTPPEATRIDRVVLRVPIPSLRPTRS